MKYTAFKAFWRDRNGKLVGFSIGRSLVFGIVFIVTNGRATLQIIDRQLDKFFPPAIMQIQSKLSMNGHADEERNQKHEELYRNSNGRPVAIAPVRAQGGAER